MWVKIWQNFFSWCATQPSPHNPHNDTSNLAKCLLCVQFQHFNVFAKKLTLRRLFFATGILRSQKAKLDGPILESFQHFRKSRKHFHWCASFGAVGYDIGKKAIFWRSRRFFIVGTKIAVLGQKLPIWDESCRFQDKNRRSGDKLPFSRWVFCSGNFWQFFQVFTAMFSNFNGKIGLP